ncbi:hypothetical protein E4634_13315 [Mangrovimicrobium sediminis]|uniref:Uncharacterized protein n=1 Tax=Mangrovimicrobium sediminis TaxID=2562682 RepID=A0A4Z0LZ95_9GAMM|nr:hypothetical protein [Haliea sp. SAOS-164]TGD72506.1 hypothetical protein E4634_13315 [Haliea sp. SAOS-164]
MPRSTRLSKSFIICLMFLAACFSAALRAETVEQKVWVKAVDTDGSCRVTAYFKGDHDNCSNHDAHGRDDCPKDTGCICTRQEKHVTWAMDGSESFSVMFDQGSENPFVEKGDNACSFSSNKKGKLRCRVKEKNTPKGIYHYSVHVNHCEPAKVKLKLY